MTTLAGLEERLDNEMVVVMQVREARANLLGAKDKAKGSVLAHVEAAFQETDQALKEQEQLAAKVTADIFALEDPDKIRKAEAGHLALSARLQRQAESRTPDSEPVAEAEEASNG